MKKLIPYLIAATLLITGVSSVCGVEKKQKETPAATPTQPAKKDTSTKPTKPPEQKVQPKPADKTAKVEKKYDNFVDRNNNGVDDRKENLKKKDGK
jgi:hypothetical protein